MQSLVLEHSPASPGNAQNHFLARLSVETDCSDVYADLSAGISGFRVVDPRSPDAYDQGHVPTAVSIPHRSIDDATTASLSKADLIVVYCWGPGCNAAQKAGLKLAGLGFQVKEMLGGFEYWVKEGYPVEGTHADNPPIYQPHPVG
jgi:rhodanese-related sulfurtransferase